MAYFVFSGVTTVNESIIRLAASAFCMTYVKAQFFHPLLFGIIRLEALLAIIRMTSVDRTEQNDHVA